MPTPPIRVHSTAPEIAPSRRLKPADPCTIVIFGASGDLAKRKLVPALWSMFQSRVLPEPFAVIGVGRSEMSNEQFRARRPPALTSVEYTRAYNEVKALGGPVGYPGVTRTPDQTQIGYFFSGNIILMFEGTLRGLVEACEMGTGGKYCKSFKRLGDTARLFALANLAGADSGISTISRCAGTWMVWMVIPPRLPRRRFSGRPRHGGG